MSVRECVICGKPTTADGDICSRTRQCIRYRDALIRSHKQGRPWRLDDMELRATVLGDDINTQALARLTGFTRKTLLVHTKANFLERRWSVPALPIYYPSAKNWMSCYVAACLIAFPTLTLEEMMRICGVSDATLRRHAGLLGAKFVWVDSRIDLHMQG